MTTTISKTYSELSRLDTFEERYQYLKLGGGVGRSTFGFDRHINQQFYTSREWHNIRDFVIVRDECCDLGAFDHEILVGTLIHHMNPMSVVNILEKEEWILDPEFLITTTHLTHNAIHYGVDRLIPKVVMERSPRDTKLW